MALVHEDGTAKTDAESLCAVAFADTYHSNRANTAWAALSTADKEANLRKATDYMAVYRERWAGWRKTTTQALDWPRSEVPMKDAVYYSSAFLSYYPDDEVPAIVAKACAELALRAIDGELLADQETPVLQETVGPLTTVFAEGARQAVRYPAIDALLAPLFAASGGMLRVSRA